LTNCNTFNFRVNNFDLIRLLAALQVVFIHGYEHFGVELPRLIIVIISAFPGVPIFFVVSGYLISASWERSPSLATYLKNRFLRIYPGLLFCFIFSLIVLFTFYNPSFELKDIVPWLFAQVTIAQFYNPEFIRGFGTGVLNGSLWTIPVEIQFYLILPVFYFFAFKFNWNKWFLSVLITTLVIFNQLYIATLSEESSLVLKLFGVTVFPYLYMFLIGVLLQRNINFVDRYLKGNAVKVLVSYIVVDFLLYSMGADITGNDLNPASSAILCLLTISFGYTATKSFGNILKGNDISFGIYIYHMVLINILLHLKLLPPEINMLVMLVLTLIIALFSWHYIEKPALSLKNFSIRNIRVDKKTV
jgi:peptidoglycan/LPS O-acetylase OafA/YrhL